jgi:hypothetical protein
LSQTFPDGLELLFVRGGREVPGRRHLAQRTGQ